MYTILFINACTRGEDSRTLGLCRRLLSKLQHKHEQQDLDAEPDQCATQVPLAELGQLSNQSPAAESNSLSKLDSTAGFDQLINRGQTTEPDQQVNQVPVTDFDQHAKLNHGNQVVVREINLEQHHLEPLTAERLQKRDTLLVADNLDDPMFDDAHALAEADMVVIGAPYWDMSFPAALKIWAENVSVVGITFAYAPNGAPIGLCKADELYYVTTSGGYINDANFGYDYIAALGRLFGIEQSHFVSAEGLDIVGANVEAILKAAADAF